MKNINDKKKISSKWFKKLQKGICDQLELIETNYSDSSNKFKKKNGYVIKMDRKIWVEEK